MSVTININGLSLCHKGSGGWTAATAPDVCLTPPVPVPVPYPNFAYSSDLAGGTVTVFADGGNSIAHKPSIFATSTGDEPGTAGGVISGTFMLEASWITFSADVRIEGENACRLTDKMLHNHGNTHNCGGEMQPPVFGNRMKCDAKTCTDAFAAAQRETDQIVAMTDPIERNKVISAKYAEMYMNNNELQWAGAAAFASKQVGCGMVQARDMTTGATLAGGGVGVVGGGAVGAGIGAFFGGVGAIPGWAIGSIIGGLVGGGAGAGTGYAATQAMLDFLARGNAAVFQELYPILKLYEFYKANCTVQAFKDCLNQLGQRIPPGVKQGFDDVLAGRPTDGAIKMLRHEQEFTLQQEVYDHASFQAIMEVNEITGLAPVNLAYSADCTAAANLTRSFTNGNLYDFNDRWPYAQDVANGFVDQATNNTNYINGQLQTIISRGGGP